MPRSLDPSAKLTMVLACDVDKTPQPKMFAKSPTLNQQRKLIGVLTSLDKGSLAEQFDAILDAAAMMLTGWENIPVEFSRENIGEVLNLEELVEVLGFLVASTGATADDKKKSESPHSSDAANFVSPASVVVATL
jgi:hypothetical protein